MLHIGKFVFNDIDLRYCEVEKCYEDDLYAKFKVDVEDWDDNISTFITAYFIKDRNKLKDFTRKTGEIVSWIEPNEKGRERFSDYILRWEKLKEKYSFEWIDPDVGNIKNPDNYIAVYYYTGICGIFGGDFYLRRITKPDADEDALLYLIDDVDCKYVIPCNKEDRFFFLFSYEYCILVAKHLNLW